MFYVKICVLVGLDIPKLNKVLKGPQLKVSGGGSENEEKENKNVSSLVHHRGITNKLNWWYRSEIYKLSAYFLDQGHEEHNKIGKHAHEHSERRCDNHHSSAPEIDRQTTHFGLH